MPTSQSAPSRSPRPVLELGCAAFHLLGLGQQWHCWPVSAACTAGKGRHPLDRWRCLSGTAPTPGLAAWQNRGCRWHWTRSRARLRACRAGVLWLHQPGARVVESGRRQRSEPCRGTSPGARACVNGAEARTTRTSRMLGVPSSAPSAAALGVAAVGKGLAAWQQAAVAGTSIHRGRTGGLPQRAGV